MAEAEVIPHGAQWVDEITVIDAHGNPCVKVGCPNCEDGTRWLTGLDYAARCNSGFDPAGPCSQRCRYQLEYAQSLGPREVPEGER